MEPDCDSVALTFNDISEAYDPNELCSEMHDNVCLAMTEAMTDSLEDPESTTSRDGNNVKKRIVFELPEKGEQYLFNPVTDSPVDPIYKKVLIGGRRIFFFACYSLHADAAPQH